MSLPRCLIHNEYDLQEIAELQDRPIELIERDFALVTVAAHLVDQFPGQLCFKGGFVLRHVRGYTRFSGDLDATRTNPPNHKIAASEIAEAMRRATDEPMLRIDPGAPATDSRHSLDFDQIAFHTPHHDGQIAVEISYREAVVDEPEWAAIGSPYYAQFQIPVLTLEETVAEKLRTLLQRQRPTDLSDLALILRESGDQLDRDHVSQLAATSAMPSSRGPGTTPASSTSPSRIYDRCATRAHPSLQTSAEMASISPVHRFASSPGAHDEPRRTQGQGHYSFLNISGHDRTGAIRRAGKLVDFARDVLQR